MALTDSSLSWPASPAPALFLPACSPALIQLHHYAWWHAVGDGVEDGGLFYFPAAEAQLGVFAHVSAGQGGSCLQSDLLRMRAGPWQRRR